MNPNAEAVIHSTLLISHQCVMKLSTEFDRLDLPSSRVSTPSERLLGAVPRMSIIPG